MGNRVTKTEHAGPKKGVGAFYGRKRWAKQTAAVKRRQAARAVIEEQRRDADSARKCR
ncbi:MAG: hypothetical protein ACKVZ0_08995 [Gemmatimonadales bacterium]